MSDLPIEHPMPQPSGDFLPPENIYWSPYLHSKIEEAWLATGRKRPPLDSAARGYIAELASGKRILTTEKPDQLKEILPQLSKEYQISDVTEENSDAFEKTVYADQITKAINLDVNHLKQAGVSASEIQFYDYWAKRFWLTREYSPRTVYGSVEKRFKELQDLITKEKKKA